MQEIADGGVDGISFSKQEVFSRRIVYRYEYCELWVDKESLDIIIHSKEEGDCLGEFLLMRLNISW